ncbi:hypothetical protein BGW42_006843 [Actinomortierella wolfii]|nr:hypothetical protein BGW42_006843 [Actinomortierella wolfii]
MPITTTTSTSSSSSTTTSTTSRTRITSPRARLLLALCCYCLVSSSLEWSSLGVSAASVAVVTRNGVYHHIDRRQLPDAVPAASAPAPAPAPAAVVAASEPDAGGVRLPHSPYTPSNGGDNAGDELQTGPSRKKKRSLLLSDDGGILSKLLYIKPMMTMGRGMGKGDRGNIFGDGGQVASSLRSSSSGASLKDQSNMAGQVEFADMRLSNMDDDQQPLQQQQRPQQQQQTEENDDNDAYHQHEVKEGVAAKSEMFEHLDIWEEEDEEETAGFIEPIRLPSRNLFEGQRTTTKTTEAKDIDSHVAPKHIAHSEHDYLDDNDDDEDNTNDNVNSNDNEQDPTNSLTTTIEWSIDEWEEEFDGDLSDWADWIDDHEELQRREPEVTLKVKVKVMGHAGLEQIGEEEDKNKEDESPFQRLFTESWF